MSYYEKYNNFKTPPSYLEQAFKSFASSLKKSISKFMEKNKIFTILTSIPT